MATVSRVETVLEAAVGRAIAGEAPPKLSAALRYAVFPGGARLRPALCLAVAAACGEEDPAVADGAAAAVELLHCASLVHDDLPCFDDAPLRRGRPSVHAVFGEALAVLAGDALIVLAFEALARAGAVAPQRLPALVSAIARGVGAPGGIVAGQAWESEPCTPFEPYHRAKTAALFVAATTSGALAAGADPAPWRELGLKLGSAYQIADDLLDAVAEDENDAGAGGGKVHGRDAALNRPSAVAELGIKGAYAKLQLTVSEACAAIPKCRGSKGLRDLVQMQATRLAPQQLARSAA